MTRKELEKLKIMELRSFARAHEVPLRRNWTKAEIVDAIVRITRPRRGRKPKPSGRKITPRKPILKRPSGTRKKEAGSRTPAPPDAAAALPPARERKKPEAAPSRSAAPSGEIAPNRLTLLARDATTLFANWDIRSTRPDETRGPFRIRLRNMSRNGRDFYEMPADGLQGSCYIPLRQPGQRFICEFGFAGGRDGFRVLATSRPVHTPPDRMAAIPRGAEKFYAQTFGTAEGVAVTWSDLDPSASSR